jgi:predicted Zn-dependent protease
VASAHGLVVLAVQLALLISLHAQTPQSPEASRKAQISAAYKRATELAKAGDFPAAQKAIDEYAAQAGADDSFIHELRGTVLTQQKDYAAAEKEFAIVVERAPSSHIGRFNHAEVVFLQKRYDDAEKEFAAVEALMVERDVAIADLARYKRVICKLAKGEMPAADLLVPPVKEDEESPALTYSRAALAYRRGDLASANELAEKAQARFTEGVQNLYLDSLLELHWMEREAEGKYRFK